MKKYVIYSMRILYGFLSISVMYCLFYDLSTKNGQGAFKFSLILLPVIVLCSMGIKICEKAIQYFLLCAFIIAAVYIGIKSMGFLSFDKIVMLVFCSLIILWYFISRATRSVCWLEKPTYWGLIIYLIACIYGSYFKVDFMIRFAAFAAGCSYLIIQIYTNDLNMDDFILDYSNLERLPVQRMRQNNNRMVWIISGITSAAMIAAPYLKVDQLIMNFLRVLRAIAAWILGFLSSKEPEQIMEMAAPERKMDMGLLPIEETDSLFMKILDMILEIASWILFFALIGALLYVVLKKIMQLYQQFNERTEENGDLVENLKAVKTEEKVQLNERIRENLFFNMSPNARIRKFYRKRVQKDNKEEIRFSWTPQQLEQAVTLSEEKKEKFHAYYEKARYSNEDCTKEEMQDMLGL